jgi:hypothetical protein
MHNLNDFYPALENMCKHNNTKLSHGKYLIDIPPHLFQVDKEQLIAYSGNTGGSQGPHLVF